MLVSVGDHCKSVTRHAAAVAGSRVGAWVNVMAQIKCCALCNRRGCGYVIQDRGLVQVSDQSIHVSTDAYVWLHTSSSCTVYPFMERKTISPLQPYTLLQSNYSSRSQTNFVGIRKSMGLSFASSLASRISLYRIHSIRRRS